MGDLNNAGGENVWAKLVSFGKDIWITELDRRGGSSTHAPSGPCGAMDQPTYLAHEIALLASLSANASNHPLKAIFTYELYDEPHQGNPYVGAPRGPLHGGSLHGGVADLFYTDARSILMVL